MKIIFFGSGKIAINSLEFLIENKYDILCVVTAPDKKKGRHLMTSFTPIKEFALKEKLEIFQPLDLFSEYSTMYISNLKPDIFIVFSFGKILSKTLLDIPKKFALNIHASLLPKYRGAAPINFALINGDKKTGITIIKMNERMDEGDIIQKKEIQIDYFDNAITLDDKLAKLAVTSLKETLHNIENDKTCFIKQDSTNASYAPKLKKEDGKIIWNKKAIQIRNQIRGFLPWPGTYTFLNKKLIKIFDVEIVKLEIKREYLAGEIISFDKNGIIVATKDMPLLIKELQPSSGKRLSASQFIQGHKIKKGEKFG